MFETSMTNTEYQKRVKENINLKVGEIVKVADCWEAGLFNDKEFEVVGEPKKIGSTWCAKLQGIGYFDIARVVRAG